jgi:hypothetical protein
VLKMQDDAGGDEETIAVPVPKLRRRYARITEYSRAGDHNPADPGKWVKGDPLGRRRRGAPTRSRTRSRA